MKHEAWTLRGWEDEGITWVIVARESAAPESDGWIEVAAFLIDAWCLGVKETALEELPREELDELLGHYVPAADREPLDPACARKLIEGAAAYAQSLGFLPHRDFRKTRKILGKIDASACDRVFTFGRDGKPCYVVGPDDDDARVNRVLAILTARFGEDGFEFFDDAALDESESAAMAEADDAADESIDTFFRFIEGGGLANKTLTSFEADGFITGLHLLPDAPQPEEWLPALWGGAEMAPKFPDEAAEKSVIDGALAMHANVAERFAVEAFEPDVPFADESDHVPMSRRFCAGVLRAISLRPSMGAWFRSHPEGAAAWATLERIAADTTDATNDKPADADLGVVIGEALRVLHGATAGLRAPAKE